MVNIQIQQAYFSYNNSHHNGFILRDINLSVKAGEMVGLIGPNGSGKTTLIKLTSGILKPKRGNIKLDGADLNRMSRNSIARCVAVVPQQFHTPFAFTTSEVVMMGRTPFIRTIAGETAADREAAATAMELAGISQFAQRRFDELSGGEKQKVILAMALAQQPGLLLLDEPTTHLDIWHQVETLELVKNLNVSHNLTVIAAIHDLNLAALYFDRLILLKAGSVLADGTPSQVLTEDSIRGAFSASVRVEKHPA
ncbi:MAG: ABC transporter ATP-binding protein, partial [Dehalococcoidales bacterium]|nr:ABC transporter ATP-binding protein [Dehalococcoidales bacterium]